MRVRRWAMLAVAAVLVVCAGGLTAKVRAEEAATAAQICAGIPGYIAAYDYTIRTWPNAANPDDLTYFTAMVRADATWCAGGSQGSAVSVQTAQWHFGQASVALSEYQRIAQSAPQPPATGRRSAVMVRVVDGDTVDVTLDGVSERLRLIGMDTPETVDPGKPVQCYGPEASARAAQLLPSGATVQLAADPTQDVRDRFGRLLVYLWLPDGRNYAEVMIAEGFAHEYTYANVYQQQAAFRAAEQQARNAGRGFWAATTCAGNTEQPATSPGATPTATPPPSDVYYANCAAVRAAGKAPLHRGQPGYRSGLDGDGDGVACE